METPRISSDIRSEKVLGATRLATDAIFLKPFASAGSEKPDGATITFSEARFAQSSSIT
jgi:hypothetical protein